MSIPKPEFPRPQRVRKNWLNLNGTWDFMLFPTGSEAEETTFSQARTGYDRQITVPFSWVSSLSGIGEDVAGIGWYRKNVTFSANDRVFLCFGAVDYLCTVYVNGKQVCSHQGGYTPFEADVTEFWTDGENTIEVRAEDYRREDQTYGKQGYGDIQGIWQTVWLEARPASFIRDFVIDTQLSGLVTITANVCAPDGAVLQASFDGITAQGITANGKAELSFTVGKPKLWSVDSPYLYEGTLSLEQDGATDLIETYFGIRQISTANVDGRGYKWILLNGVPVYLNGTLDQAYHLDGHFTYPTDADMRGEVYRLKRLGLNMVRIHIKPEDPRKLYWMDKLGMLVMQDMPCFWGDPTQTAMDAYENEWPDAIMRDINHPSIFSWVMFNETWGLFTKDSSGNKTYKKETQDWVVSVYRRAKALDPTRIIEDNSVCNYDHTESDINTWHFYINGYEQVRDHIRDVVKNTYPGSSFNYLPDYKQTDAPLMNSECGLVWGVDDTAGDSDLAWHYHYMINEYRLHEKLCGFIFTEFHDVVNEFNGYYRIDDTDKDWGYQDFARGMTIRDLHNADFIALDGNPCTALDAGASFAVPAVYSCFSDQYLGQPLTVAWELWHDGLDGRVCDDQGSLTFDHPGYGAHSLGSLSVRMPEENAACILSVYLKDKAGSVISRNFTTFNVVASVGKNIVDIPVASGKAEGFPYVWQAHLGDKLCLGGEGSVEYTVTVPTDGFINGITLFAELSAKRTLNKDRKSDRKEDLNDQDHRYMRGYKVNRGDFENSYLMTDETLFPSDIEVLVNDVPVTAFRLDNDPADCRGILSWHIQPNHRKLNEAGSYGEAIRVEIPSRLIPAIAGSGSFRLTFKASNGLAVYGRNSGRYARGLWARIW